ESFARQQARTRRFRLGAPADFTISPCGTRIVFTRSGGGSDPVNRLWVADVGDGPLHERLVADPVSLLGGSEDVPTTERARRERMRITSEGITGYSTDTAVRVAGFALSGQIGIADLTADRPALLLDLTGPAIDPQIDPTGQRVAWVADGSLHQARIDGTEASVLAAPDGDGVTWGLANFLAAEEFDRSRGFWWSPDGQSLIVERVDDRCVDQWWLADPATPSAEPAPIRYPAAGTQNPKVSLWLVDLAGRRVAIDADPNGSGSCEYVTAVHWSAHGPALLAVLNRAQNRSLVLAVDAQTWMTHPIADLRDPCWVELIPGTPAWTPSGQLLTTATGDNGMLDSLAIDGDGSAFAAIRPVRAVLDVAQDGMLLQIATRPTSSTIMHVAWDGTATARSGGGWNSAARGGDTMLRIGASLDSTDIGYEVTADSTVVGRIESLSERPCVNPRPQLLTVGTRALNATVQWPANHAPGSRKLPVIMNPYGGPRAQRVIESGRSFAETQWLADQGFAVIVADGRGSSGRGPAWEREVFGDLADVPLQDQVDALAGVAELFPDDIDTDRVAIMGWSFGGYLSALAVLRRPDVFHAAVAGAPVTDWRLYDTAYTERYLGDPTKEVANYASTSLLPLARHLRRPLMIIHGLADDNVVVAHSLQLSQALTTAGRPHTFLPLPNVTHMTPQEDIAENTLRLQLEFITSSLAVPHP
ncbi:MAG: prolyl oligopeptidase family serine peptidase, partial [Actinomycetes bacterium]